MVLMLQALPISLLETTHFLQLASAFAFRPSPIRPDEDHCSRASMDLTNSPSGGQRWRSPAVALSEDFMEIHPGKR